jgi:hypothetical protein
MAITRASVTLFAALMCGCATSTTTTELAKTGLGSTGLANAPKLGTYPTHDRPTYDVIADGQESCEASGMPRMWSRSPPCAPVEAPAPRLLTPRPAASRAWLPRSGWSLSECATSDPGLEPDVASCCPANEPVCAR